MRRKSRKANIVSGKPIYLQQEGLKHDQGDHYRHYPHRSRIYSGKKPPAAGLQLLGVDLMNHPMDRAESVKPEPEREEAVDRFLWA